MIFFVRFLSAIREIRAHSRVIAFCVIEKAICYLTGEKVQYIVGRGVGTQTQFKRMTLSPSRARIYVFVTNYLICIALIIRFSEVVNWGQFPEPT